MTSGTNDINSLIRISLSEQREYRNAGLKRGMDFSTTFVIFILQILYLGLLMSCEKDTLLHLIIFLSCPSVKPPKILREKILKSKDIPSVLVPIQFHTLLYSNRIYSDSCHLGGEQDITA